MDHASTVVPDERRTDGAGRGRQRSPSHRGGILRDAPADARREESQSCVARAGCEVAKVCPYENVASVAGTSFVGTAFARCAAS